jgi:hypothetical protein
MDHQRFDQLTKALATGTSRRTLLGGLASGAIAAIVGSFRRAPSAGASGCTG